MSVPQVGALVTDRNREQAERICELKGWTCAPVFGKSHDVFISERCKDGLTCLCGEGKHASMHLPNGSLTPDQVWGMLEAEGIVWEDGHGWVRWLPNKNFFVISVSAIPHDLTAAMDALIKVLEAKQ